MGLDADRIPDDIRVLETRVPADRMVAGLTYGAGVSMIGRHGRYVSVDGGETWAITIEAQRAGG